MLNLRATVAVLAAFLTLLSPATGHPGESTSVEKLRKAIAARDLAGLYAKRASTTCGNSTQHAAVQARAAARRALTAQVLREKRGVVDKPMVSKRDQTALNTWLNTCHDMSAEHDYSLSTTEATVFTSNATSVLTPETIIGPYFVAGEYIRGDVTEDQLGVPIHLDIQFIDIDTCNPIPNMLVDIWHANATGVYSGVVGSGLNTTFLRGIQLTDYDGVTEFDSIFPGHYMGRTPHIHVVSRRGGQILDNGTYTGGTVNHIGQLYFDQDLIGEVGTMVPYTLTTVPLTTNVEDMFIQDEATADYDPFLSYVLLSDNANDGLLMWITIGINTTADYDDDAYAAAHYYKDGGVANTQAMPIPIPTGGPGAPPGFSLPPGFPSGIPSGLPTGGFPPGGIPGFPMPTATAVPAVQPWGPCTKEEEE